MYRNHARRLRQVCCCVSTRQTPEASEYRDAQVDDDSGSSLDSSGPPAPKRIRVAADAGSSQVPANAIYPRQSFEGITLGADNHGPFDAVEAKRPF